jgi:hypothetical protein
VNSSERSERVVKILVSYFTLLSFGARLAAKFLEGAGRTDIPLALGIETSMDPNRF